MAFSEKYQHLIRENEPLAPYCWLQIGGEARYFAEPNTLDDLCGLLAEAHQQKIPVRLIGGGSNILVREAGVDGLVVHLATSEFSKIQVSEHSLIAGGGAKLNHVISTAVGAALAGLEHLAGIPGSIGGAVAGNAGVINDDIGSRVTRIQAVDRTGVLNEWTRDSLQFGFRRSNLDDVIIVEVELSLEPAELSELTRRMQSAWIVKRAAQPASGTRVVQAFIDPSGTSISDALEAAGLKGAVEGDVSLSARHPGFLVVSGEASSEQVLALLERVTRAVEAQSGIQLQSRLRIW